MMFNDSDAQRQEYAKVGEPYKETSEDANYNKVLKQIESDPNKKERITAMTRIVAGPGEEYITYHHTWEGTNAIGSFCKTTQTNVGIYGKFEPVYERYINEDNTYSQRMISKNTIVSYFIPFNKENAEKLHKLCNDLTGRINERTRYYIMPEGGTKIAVNTYHDWLNGEAEDLQEHGKITLITNPLKEAKQK